MATSRYPFEYSGYFFIACLILAIAGFWPTYFARFFDGTADFNMYFHFHAVTAVLWILFLIVQPMLIRMKRLDIHRLVGRSSYLLVPLFYISITLLAHSRITGEETNLGISLWIPFKDLVIFTFGYGIAIKYRRRIAIHARGMVVAGIVLIEPALVRLIGNIFDLGQATYLLTIGTVYALLIWLIIRERHETSGRWVFPIALGLYIFVHSVIIFNIQIGSWNAMAEWFAALPLT